MLGRQTRNDPREARRTMTDQEMSTEPTSETAPKRPGVGRLAAIGGAIVLVVLLASAAGAVVGHELWTSTKTAAPAPAPTPSPGSSNNFGGFGGTGSIGSGGSSTGAGAPANADAI